MIRIGSRALVLVAATAGLVTAACGGGSKSAAPTTTRLPKPTTTAAAAPAAPALWFASGGKIMVSIGGGPPESVTQGPNDDQPAPSPDGKQVAYIRKTTAGGLGGQLWLAGADGSNPHLLAALITGVGLDPTEPSQAFWPKWSPDGSRIAFLRTIGLDGGNLSWVTVADGQEVAFTDPLWVGSYNWAPDGKSLAYVNGASDYSPLDLGVVDVASQKATTIATATADFGSVAFTTDGKRVLFTNSAVPADAQRNIPFQMVKVGVYTVPVGGGGDPQPVIEPDTADDITWAGAEPGGCILFTSEPAGGEGGAAKLERICPKATTPDQLRADVVLFPAPPAQAADGSAIAFLVGTGSGPGTLRVLNKGSQAALTVATDVSAFAWGRPA